MRVNNFNLFLLKEALLESVMHSSTDLRNILSNIRYKEGGKVAEIAQIILTFIEKQTDIKTSFNGLDLSPTKNDDIGFVPDSQFQKLLADDKNPWDKSKSYTKIGRMIRQLLKDNGQSFLEKDIEQFVNAYKSQWDRKHGLHKKIKVVSGKDIQFWYSNKNYYDRDRGTLGSSCMSSANDNHYMQIYSGNPDRISLVILTEDDKLTARALLWKLDNDTNGHELYLDRIYTMQDSDRNFVKNWVMENIVKDNISFTDYHDDDDLGEARVNVNSEFSHYPYADTMSYLYKELGKDHKLTNKGILSNRKDLEIDDHIKFTMFSTSGSISCYSGHEYISHIDAWYAKSECVQAFSSKIGLYRDWYPKELCEYSKVERKYYPKEELIYSDAMKDWILKEDAIEDPKFGFVLQGYIVDAITGYKGSKDIFSLYKQLGEGDTTDFTIDKRVKDSDCFRKTIGNMEYSFDEDLDINGYPIFLTIAASKAINTIPLNILKKLPIYNREYENYYITKQDADYYNIETDEDNSEILNIGNLQNNMFYKEYLKNDVKVNKKYESNYKKYITSAHEYMKEFNRSYNDSYASGEILDRVRFITNYVVDSAIDGYKKWARPISNEQFESYFETTFNLYGEDNDLMMRLRTLSAIFCVIDSNRDDNDHIRDIVSASVENYLVNNENLKDENQIKKLSNACGRFASQNLESSCVSNAIDAFEKRIKRYIGDDKISNYRNLLSAACKTLTKEKIDLRIKKKLGKLF